jgi:hypothetical protein
MEAFPLSAVAGPLPAGVLQVVAPLLWLVPPALLVASALGLLWQARGRGRRRATPRLPALRLGVAARPLR